MAPRISPVVYPSNLNASTSTSTTTTTSASFTFSFKSPESSPSFESFKFTTTTPPTSQTYLGTKSRTQPTNKPAKSSPLRNCAFSGDNRSKPRSKGRLSGHRGSDSGGTNANRQRRAHRRNSSSFPDDDDNYELDSSDSDDNDTQLFIPHMPPEVDIALLFEQIRIESGVADLESLRHGPGFRRCEDVLPPPKPEIIDLTKVMDQMELNNKSRCLARIDEEMDGEMEEEYERRQQLQREQEARLEMQHAEYESRLDYKDGLKEELKAMQRAYLRRLRSQTQCEPTIKRLFKVFVKRRHKRTRRTRYRKRHTIYPCRTIKELLHIRLPPTINIRNVRRTKSELISAGMFELAQRIQHRNRFSHEEWEGDSERIGRCYSSQSGSEVSFSDDCYVRRAPWDDEDNDAWARSRGDDEYVRRAPWDDDDNDAFVLSRAREQDCILRPLEWDDGDEDEDVVGGASSSSEGGYGAASGGESSGYVRRAPWDDDDEHDLMQSRGGYGMMDRPRSAWNDEDEFE